MQREDTLVISRFQKSFPSARESEDSIQSLDDIDEDESGLQFSERINQLYQYGLSPLQVRIFVDLMQYGPSKARDLTRRLGLNRVDVYRILNTLKKRGLLETTVENPLVFAAVSPNEAVMILLEEEEEKFRKLRIGAKDLLAWLKTIRPKTPSAEIDETNNPTFKMLYGRQVVETWRKMLGKAKKEVVAVWSEYGLDFQRETGFTEPYISCTERKIPVRVITVVTSKNLSYARQYGSMLNLRHNVSARNSLRYLIIDDDQACISTTSLPIDRPNQSLSSIWTNSRAFIQVMRGEFEVLWAGGTDLDSRQKEIESSKLNSSS
jgi:sugar-specific transcriptional regulator TrmB